MRRSVWLALLLGALILVVVWFNALTVDHGPPADLGPEVVVSPTATPAQPQESSLSSGTPDDPDDLPVASSTAEVTNGADAVPPIGPQPAGDEDDDYDDDDYDDDD